MFIRVIDNNTKEIIREEKDTITHGITITVDKFRRMYNNVTIEQWYGEPKGKPFSSIRSFH